MHRSRAIDQRPQRDIAAPADKVIGPVDFGLEGQLGDAHACPAVCEIRRQRAASLLNAEVRRRVRIEQQHDVSIAPREAIEVRQWPFFVDPPASGVDRLAGDPSPAPASARRDREQAPPRSRGGGGHGER